MTLPTERLSHLWDQAASAFAATRDRVIACRREIDAQENGPLPVHETAVCTQCGWAGVTLRGEVCDCHRCNYRWRWPLAAIDIGLD